MTPAPRIRIQSDDFDVGVEVDALRSPTVGAVAAFCGTVRERGALEVQKGTPADVGIVGQPDTSALELEHYPGMTERAIEAMIDAAHARFDIQAARVVHRIGVLAPSDKIVLVVVSAAHRGAAFAACEFLMDYLKTQAPFWKKEHRPDGRAEWVDARVADDAALQRWGLASGNAGASSTASQPATGPARAGASAESSA